MLYGLVSKRDIFVRDETDTTLEIDLIPAVWRFSRNIQFGSIGKQTEFVTFGRGTGTHAKPGTLGTRDIAFLGQRRNLALSNDRDFSQLATINDGIIIGFVIGFVVGFGFVCCCRGCNRRNGGCSNRRSLRRMTV